MFENIKSQDLNWKKSKYQIAVNELVFLSISFQVTVSGLVLKNYAIINLLQLTNKTELQKIFGMLNYLVKFVPKLSIEPAILRKFLEKINDFIYNTPQIDAFIRLTYLVIHTQTFIFFDKNLPISWDTYKLGLGECVLIWFARPPFGVEALPRYCLLASFNYGDMKWRQGTLLMPSEQYYAL